MKTLLFVYLALFILVASACQKSSTAGLSSSCTNNSSNCNPSIYNNSYGYTGYNNTNNTPFNNYNNSAYLCNCPAGTIPTYNSYAGLGCVNSSYYNSGLYGGYYSYYYMSWSYSYNNWSTLPQLYRYNYSTNSNSNSQCYNGAVQSCVVDQANNCPAGSLCRTNSSGTGLGLCVTSHR